MGEAIVKGASHFFKKAHDGFEAWIDRFNGGKVYDSSRYAMPAVTAFIVLTGLYELSAHVSNAVFDTNLTTLQSIRALNPR